LIYPNLIIIF